MNAVDAVKRMHLCSLCGTPCEGRWKALICPQGLFSESTPPVTPRLHSMKWPVWAQPFKILAKPGDKGLGDIIARTIGPIGGDAYKRWYQKIFNSTCGCEERQEDLNLKFPLDTA